MNSTIDIINAVVVATGVPSIVAGMIYIGRKLQILDDLKNTSDKIKQNLKVVCDFLIKNNPDFNSSDLVSYSPLQLSESGARFIREIGFFDVFTNNKEDFFHCIENENPKLKYDVEIAAIKSISLLGDKEYMNFLKIFFYNNPRRSMSDTAPTLGVYIRDRYLEEHPHIVE